jgi:cytochrome c2
MSRGESQPQEQAAVADTAEGGRQRKGRKAWFFLAIGLAAASILMMIFSAYLVGAYGAKELMTRVQAKLFGKPLHGSAPSFEVTEGIVESIFFPLTSRAVDVPVERSGAGGGLTSFGDAVVLLTHEGRFFAARSADKVSRLSIEAPENGYSDFVAASKLERYKDYWFIFDFFRYNAIMYFSANGKQGLAISYTEYHADKECFNTAVALLYVDEKINAVEQISASKTDWDVIYRTRPCLPLKPQYRALEGHMGGGRLAFKSPSTIYLSSGDYHWDGLNGPKALAQQMDNDYGKVIAIDLTSREPTIVSRGHRNMQGIAVDRDGRVWVLEHGIRGGDELNLVVKDADYGWPSVTLGTLYSRLPVPNTRSYGRHDGFAKPVFAWLPSVAVSSLTTIDNFHEAWDGDLLAASLINRALHRIRIEDNRVLFAERIPVGDHRIRYAHVHKGQIVLWTDDRKLIFLSVKQSSYSSEFLTGYLAKRPYGEDRRSKVKAAVEECQACHSLDPGDNSKAPSLATVFGGSIASTGFDGYSKSMRAKSGTWSRADLKAFLTNPQAFVPGTIMPDPGIKDPFIVDEVVDVLEAVKITEPGALDFVRAKRR